MIVTSAGTGATSRLIAPGHEDARWQSLARRAMLHSECEAVEHWRLPAGYPLQVSADHGVEEALIVLEGSISVDVPGEAVPEARAGQCALVPHGVEATIRAGADGAVLVSVRALPSEITRALPPRRPGLPA
ncbi:hypothetical protein AB0H73_12790 [Streptomyces olivoreticuli]|uniref:hypothetical protein n=1 Tax=Streptomyces olivoreticuli TaxID=68246 RepID=UPI000E2262B5|nr:hypothetical protein [Streptomyces olivoreticuli]